MTRVNNGGFMIDRIHERLCEWADQTMGGFGGGFGSPMGAMIDNRTAEYSRGKRKRVAQHVPVRVVDASGEHTVHRLRFTAATETATGVQTRVARERTVAVNDSAMDTADAVATLPDDLRECVHVFYFDGDLAARVRAKKLCVSVATMYRRRDAAHVILDARLYGSDLPKVSNSYPQA